MCGGGGGGGRGGGKRVLISIAETKEEEEGTSDDGKVRSLTHCCHSSGHTNTTKYLLLWYQSR